MAKVFFVFYIFRLRKWTFRTNFSIAIFFKFLHISLVINRLMKIKIENVKIYGLRRRPHGKFECIFVQVFIHFFMHSPSVVPINSRILRDRGHSIHFSVKKTRCSRTANLADPQQQSNTQNNAVNIILCNVQSYSVQSDFSHRMVALADGERSGCGAIRNKIRR